MLSTAILCCIQPLYVLKLMFQDMENKIRSTLYEIYFGKTRDIVNGVRSTMPLQEESQKKNFQNDLAAALQNRQANS